jgi:hypothetical protein
MAELQFAGMHSGQTRDIPPWHRYCLKSGMQLKTMAPILVAAAVIVPPAVFAAGGAAVGAPAAATEASPAMSAPAQAAPPQTTPTQSAVPGNGQDNLNTQPTAVPGSNNNGNSAVPNNQSQITTVPGGSGVEVGTAPGAGGLTNGYSGIQTNNFPTLATNLSGVYTNYQIMQTNHWWWKH